MQNKWGGGGGGKSKIETRIISFPLTLLYKITSTSKIFRYCRDALGNLKSKFNLFSHFSNSSVLW